MLLRNDGEQSLSLWFKNPEYYYQKHCPKMFCSKSAYLVSSPNAANLCKTLQF